MPLSPVDVARRFWGLMGTNDFAAVGEVLADDFILEWPQSNERIRGRERFAQVNKEYPAYGRWTFRIDRIFGDTGQAVTEVRVSDGTQQGRALTFFTVRNGLVTKIVEYWPEAYAAPPNRAHLVERIL